MAQDIYSSLVVHGDVTADNLHGTVDMANKAKGMIVVQAQTTSTPGHWVATVPEITTLEYGMQICIRVPAGYDSRPVLNINSLGEVPITSQTYDSYITTWDIGFDPGDYVVVTFCPIYDESMEEDYIDAWVTSASSGYITGVISNGIISSMGYFSQRIRVYRGSILDDINTAKYYTSTGQNTDGAMTQKAITDALENAGGGLTITTYPAD